MNRTFLNENVARFETINNETIDTQNITQIGYEEIKILDPNLANINSNQLALKPNLQLGAGTPMK